MKIPPAVYGVTLVLGLAAIASDRLAIGIVFLIGTAIAAFWSKGNPGED